MKRVLPLVIASAFLFVSCISMEDVPTDSQIRGWAALEPFVLQPVAVTGVYRNLDIDSVVFHYTTNLTAEDEFWRTLERQAASAGWRRVDGTASAPDRRKYETFQRLKPKGELFFSSAEEVRVAYSPTRVVVAFVQSDQTGEPRPVDQTSEGRFADREVWARFNELVSRSGGK